ncbi:stage VI sporulation protein F [Jeotgalibacillus sp. ET6]|uniref:stage VI sporulation protein F n=1 Tax=Jeotgalibacillus TaxID=157226 RepID=UPI0024182983|nr:stage VI sporulation protein F [Jeotgalibacillus sp. ET6]MDG5473661.1 stage VI sporulation protein F [Jeotgalibacillus sp. ET6]
MFDRIEKKTGVKMDDILKLAKSLKDADFKDEKTVRSIISKVSSMAKKPVTKEKEDMLVQTILSGKVPKDLTQLGEMLKKKK